MKSFLACIIIFALPARSFAQSDSALVYRGVVNVDSATKSQLFDRARTWFADYYKNSKAVLQISDRESGELTGKPIISVTYKYHYFGADHKATVDVNATVRVLVKDGKYKYEVYNLHEPTVFNEFTTSDVCPCKVPMQKQSRTDAMWMDAKKNLSKEVNELVTSLNTYMLNKTLNTKDDF